MRTSKRHARPKKSVFCLLLVTVLLCLTVFAAVPENGVNTPMLGAGDTHDHDSTRNRSGDNGAANAVGDAVTDAADAIGGAVSDAGNAAGEVISGIGEAAGEVVDGAANAVGGNQSGAGASGALPKDNAPAGAGWVWILILVAAAAAVFFLILMPGRRRET